MPKKRQLELQEVDQKIIRKLCDVRHFAEIDEEKNNRRKKCQSRQNRCEVHQSLLRHDLHF